MPSVSTEKLIEHCEDMKNYCLKQYPILMAAGKDELAYEHKGMAKAHQDLLMRIDAGVF